MVKVPYLFTFITSKFHRRIPQTISLPTLRHPSFLKASEPGKVCDGKSWKRQRSQPKAFLRPLSQSHSIKRQKLRLTHLDHAPKSTERPLTRPKTGAVSVEILQSWSHSSSHTCLCGDVANFIATEKRVETWENLLPRCKIVLIIPYSCAFKWHLTAHRGNVHSAGPRLPVRLMTCIWIGNRCLLE